MRGRLTADAGPAAFLVYRGPDPDEHVFPLDQTLERAPRRRGAVPAGTRAGDLSAHCGDSLRRDSGAVSVPP